MSTNTVSNMRVIILMMFITCTKLLYGQEEENINDLSGIVDSNYYNGEMIYVFADKGWEYKKDYQVLVKYQTIERNGCIYFDSTELVTKNFITTRAHSSKYNLSGLIDSVQIDISGYHYPVKATLTSGFKHRWGRMHKGNDLGCSTGTPIRSSWGGIVRYSAYNSGGYGGLVIIRHHNGLETYYAHLSERLVKPGEKVFAGQVVAKSGNTGHSKGPHLHYEIRFLENAFDPKLITGEKLIINNKMFSYLPKGNSVELRKILGTSIQSNFEVIEKKSVEITRRKRKTSSNL